MVKQLVFKGDKKPKKRKHHKVDDGDRPEHALQRAEAENEGADGDDTWVTADAPGDLAGPVIIVLPTEPPTCVACDANGSIFVSTLENMVEENPATAEPHDVRQVWVANQVAGTQSVSLKGHHGKYLAADKFGILSAQRDAISAEEQFICVVASPDSPKGLLALQTAREKFVGMDPDSTAAQVRADAEAITFATTLRVRMQAQYKPKLQASKETKARERISRKELETAVGRRLEEDEVKRLKRARKDGSYHEALLDVKVKGKHDKFA